MYNKRIELKPQAKTIKKIKGIVQGLKEGGVSVYGKSSDPNSWIHDKQFTLQICLTGELTLLMLIEELELNGISCIMANTDSVQVVCPRSKIELYEQICKKWCELTEYELEYINFRSVWYSNVNNYIGIDENIEEKKKGDGFLTGYEIFKDKSNRIIPLAVEAYFINGIEPEEFITKHSNIFDFCARGKVNKDFYLEAIKNKKGIQISNRELEELGWFEGEDGRFLNKSVDYKYSLLEDIDRLKLEKLSKENRETFNKLIRYYVSKEGVKLYKVKRENCQTNAPKVSEVVADAKYQKTLNTPSNTNLKEELKFVNHQWYIDKTNEFIFKIENGRKPKIKKIDKNQLSLF